MTCMKKSGHLDGLLRNILEIANDISLFAKGRFSATQISCEKMTTYSLWARAISQA